MKRFFLCGGPDAQIYLVDAARRKEWENWCSNMDMTAVPGDFATRVKGCMWQITFENPKMENE